MCCWQTSFSFQKISNNQRTCRFIFSKECAKLLGGVVILPRKTRAKCPSEFSVRTGGDCGKDAACD